MDKTRFKSIIEKHVRPMFTGSELSEEDENPAWKKRRVFLRNICEMIVRHPGVPGKCFCLKRSQDFEAADADFVEGLVDQLSKLESIADTPLLDDLVNPLLRRTVAVRVCPDASEVVAAVLGQYESWAEQTYEGRRIAAAVGVETDNVAPTGAKLIEVFRSPFGSVLANGLETFIKVGRSGDLIGYQEYESHPDDASRFAPLRFCRLAAWSRDSRVGLGLSRNGEILVFANQRLIFAKRRGIWRHFTHSALTKRIALQNSFKPDLCKAVYQTSLDVSFAKTGGGIALIRRTKANDLATAGIIGPKDRVGDSHLKGQSLKIIIGKPFHELDRRLRQDIVAMDGATIIDYTGKVLAAGAIIKVDGGSDGGGRLLAARTLGKYGLGIKISSDGKIEAYTGEPVPDQKPLFEVG